MPKKKLDMQPGVRYRGYGYLNEFGEFEFSPEQTGAHAGRVNLFKEKEDWKITTSKRYVFFSFKMQKGMKKLDRMKCLTKYYNEMLEIVSDYEI